MTANAIGDLRSRVALQSASDSTDSFGQPIRTWNTYATVWARVAPMRGAELVTANQQGGIVSHVITVRYRDDVVVNHRAMLGERVLAFSAVRNIEERGRWLEIDAIENAPQE